MHDVLFERFHPDSLVLSIEEESQCYETKVSYSVAALRKEKKKRKKGTEIDALKATYIH